MGAGSRSHVVRWLVLSAWILIVGACTGSSTEPSAEPADATGGIDGITQTQAASPASGFKNLEGHVFGAGEGYPSFTVQAPGTWTTQDGAFIINPRVDVMGVSVWDVGEVPRHPCRWKDSLSRPGPTVDDLVEAFTAQRLRDASTPTDITLGGHDGAYFEWSVPANSVVTGDSDFEGCDDPGNGHQDFVSWFGDGEGERWQQVAGQVDRLWILDVDGQRLVVDATYSPDASEADLAELDQVVASLRFDA